jgi:hypothetical protein
MPQAKHWTEAADATLRGMRGGGRDLGGDRSHVGVVEEYGDRAWQALTRRSA